MSDSTKCCTTLEKIKDLLNEQEKNKENLSIQKKHTDASASGYSPFYTMGGNRKSKKSKKSKKGKRSRKARKSRRKSNRRRGRR